MADAVTASLPTGESFGLGALPCGRHSSSSDASAMARLAARAAVQMPEREVLATQAAPAALSQAPEAALALEPAVQRAPALVAASVQRAPALVAAAAPRAPVAAVAVEAPHQRPAAANPGQRPTSCPMRAAGGRPCRSLSGR
jgi:hypothetical protein